MNAAYLLIFAIMFVFIVTVSFMTPMDRRLFTGIILDALDRAWGEVVYQAVRLKRWWDERKAKKA